MARGREAWPAWRLPWPMRMPCEAPRGQQMGLHNICDYIRHDRGREHHRRKNFGQKRICSMAKHPSAAFPRIRHVKDIWDIQDINTSTHQHINFAHRTTSQLHLTHQRINFSTHANASASPHMPTHQLHNTLHWHVHVPRDSTSIASRTLSASMADPTCRDAMAMVKFFGFPRTENTFVNRHLAASGTWAHRPLSFTGLDFYPKKTL